MRRNSILTGTILLTITGLVTRIIGFFYKIYLSNALGAEKLGLYQLVFPVYSVCFTIYAVGIQTSLSQMVASEVGRAAGGNHKAKLRGILSTGITASFGLALLLSFLLYHNADAVAGSVLHEPSGASSLRVLSFVFPFCGVTSCINGFYYGLKKTGIPAFTQLIEQIVRVFCVFFMATYLGGGNMKITCELAVLGLVIGEVASNVFNLASLRFTKTGVLEPLAKKGAKSGRIPLFHTLGKLALPLTLTRLITSLLHSLEAILIPSMLKQFGMSSSEALSVYGVLTGMSIPFILFPSTITNSLALLLLPTVSEAHSANDSLRIKRTAEASIKYSLLIGIFSTGAFVLFGESLGNALFHEPLAGSFLVILSWLCPFLYLSTTLNSILNGLGKAHMTFFNTIVGLGVRILFVVFLIPQRGITGYLIGLLVSQLAIALLDYMALAGSVRLQINSVKWIAIPGLCLFVMGYAMKNAHVFFEQNVGVPKLHLLAVEGCTLGVFYFLCLLGFQVVGRRDF